MLPGSASRPPPPPGEAILAWLEVLDDLSYYELFGLSPAATVDDIRAAFHAFCDAFHPDRHLGRSPREREAVLAIFKRGTEGYLVLCDLGFRERYDAQIAGDAGQGNVAPRLNFSPHSRPPPGQGGGAKGPPRLEDAVRSPSARPFARRAEELIQKGELRQAKLQLVMANHKDPANGDLEAALRDLEAKMAALSGPASK